MRTILRLAVLASLATVPPQTLGAQQADSADVASMDGIIHALYDVISGPAGQRDWNRFNSLFMEDARLIAVGVAQDSGQVRYRVLTPADFAQASGAYVEQHGFFEREVHRTTDRFGQIVHVFSTYESRNAADDAVPFQRGINSIQLVDDGMRWWIATVLWDSERPDNPIPSRYLTGR